MFMSSYNSGLFKLKNCIFKMFPSAQAIWAFNRYSRDLWVQQKAREVNNYSRVIDIGAGSCPYKIFFDHCEYVAHDFGKLADEQIQERKGYGSISIFSDICNIPVDNCSFDVVLCTEVIEHVPEPIKAVYEMGRILKPGGQLFLTAPMRSALHQVPFHYYGGFTSHWFDKFLVDAGFDFISVTPVSSIFNFYGEESLRVSLALSPFGSASNLLKIILFPVWFFTLPWLAFFCPLFCSLVDRLKIEMGGTSGYRVEARKKLNVEGM